MLFIIVLRKAKKQTFFRTVLSDILRKFLFTVEFMLLFVENLLVNVLSCNKESIFEQAAGNMPFYHVLTLDRLKAKFDQGIIKRTYIPMYSK